MANYEINVRAKLDSSSLESELNSLKNRFQNMEIKITANMPDFDKDIQSKGAAAGRKYSEAFKNSMSQKIQFKIDTGDFESKVGSLESKLQSLDSVSADVSAKIRTNMDSLNSALRVMESKDASMEEKIEAYHRFNDLLTTTRSQLNQVSQAQQALSKADALSNKMQNWLENNGNAADNLKNRVQELLNILQNSGNASPELVKLISNEFNNVASQANNAKSAVSSFGSQFGSAITMALGIGSVYQIVNKVIGAIKDMVKVTIELEDAMAQLKIVTGASDNTLSSYFSNIADTAKDIGGNIKDLIEATTTYSRLGYSLDESSILAKYTNMLQNVGDIDVSTAQNAITAITKAFDISADQIESVMDKMVAVGKALPNGIVICRKKEAISVKTGLAYYASKTEERFAA